MELHREKYWAHDEMEVQKGMESQSVIRKQYYILLHIFISMDYLGLLQTFVENFMSTAPLEIYLLRKMVTCSILILPAVFIAFSQGTSIIVALASRTRERHV